MRSQRMRRWWVISKEYGQVVPILDDGTGPMEYGRDVVEIEATTRRDALILGVREMLRLNKSNYRHYRWCADNREEGVSPFVGVKVLSETDIERGDEVLP